VVEVVVVHLLEAASDVRRNRLRVVEGALGRDVDSTDIGRLESFPLHQSVSGVRPHRDDVLVAIGERTRVEPESFRILFRLFALLRGERAGKVQFEVPGPDLDSVDADCGHVSSIQVMIQGIVVRCFDDRRNSMLLFVLLSPRNG